MNTNIASISIEDDVELHLCQVINKDHLDVPMLPEVARKVVCLAETEDSDASTLSKLIEGDQVLAGQVMRMANSALYSPNGSMVSLQQAITRLGMNLISEIALAASINSRLFDAPGYEPHIQKKLKQSFAAGLWAKEIARAARKNVEAAFLGGLLHDIGRPVAIQSIVEITRKLGVELPKETVYELEDKYQREIGVQVVKQWNMPTSVCEVVEYFDHYQQEHSAQLQTMIVVAGDLFARVLDSGSSLTSEEQLEHLNSQEVLAELNFYEDDIEALVDKAEQLNSTLGAMAV